MARDSHSCAFTIVELLIVISIIALLIALLLPALSQARDTAQATQCSSNLRQLTTVFHTYAADYEGRYLPQHRNTATGSDRPWADYRRELYALGYLNPGPETSYGQPSAAAIALCPVNVQAVAQELGGGSLGLHTAQAWGTHVYNGYYANGARYFGGGEFPPVNLVRVRVPSDTAIFADGNQGNNFLTSDTIRYVHSNPDPDGQANVAFFDGHVQQMREQQVPTNSNDVFYRGEEE